MLVTCLLLVVVAGVVVGLIQTLKQWFLVQYIFFLRYPILLGLVLVIVPWVASSNDMVGNLFDVSGPPLLVVSMLNVFAAGAVVTTFNLIFAFSPERTRLPFHKPNRRAADGQPTQDNRERDDAQARAQRQDQWAEAIDKWRMFCSVGLSLFLPLAVVIKSATGRVSSAGYAILGTAAAVLVWLLANYVGTKCVAHWLRRLEDWLFELQLGGTRRSFWRWLHSTFSDGFLDNENQRRHRDWRAKALVLFATSLGTYLVGYLLLEFKAGGVPLAGHIPVLVYLLVLLIVFAWVLAFWSFYFDKFRVPALLPLIFAWLLSYVFINDHYFQVTHTVPTDPNPTARLGNAAALGATVEPREPAACSFGIMAPVEQWVARASRREPSPTMVVVAASGGGITASAWTAQVLTGLSRAADGPGNGLGAAFARAIAMVSSVSGGSLGAAYFVDGYSEAQGFTDEALERIRVAAGESSLADTVSAIAYGDVLRVLLPVFPPPYDRGMALERSWSQHFPQPGVTLSQWRAGVEQGWRPNHILNATITETGERFVVGPVNYPTQRCAATGAAWHARGLWDFDWAQSGHESRYGNSAVSNVSLGYAPGESPNQRESAEPALYPALC